MAMDEERFVFDLRFADLNSELMLAPHTLQELLITASARSQAFRSLLQNNLVFPQRRHSIDLALPRPVLDIKRSADYSVHATLQVLGAHGRYLLTRVGFELRDAGAASGVDTGVAEGAEAVVPLGQITAVAVCVESSSFRRRDLPSWVPKVDPAWVPYITSGLTTSAAGGGELQEADTFVVPRWHENEASHVANAMVGRYFWEALRGQEFESSVPKVRYVRLDIEFQRPMNAGDNVVIMAQKTKLPAQQPPADGPDGTAVLAKLSVGGKVCCMARLSCGDEEAHPSARL